MSEVKELAQVEVSKEVEAKVEFVDGKILLKGQYDGKGLSVGLVMTVKSEYFLDELKKAIPGEIDDKLIDMLKLGLKIA